MDANEAMKDSYLIAKDTASHPMENYTSPSSISKPWTNTSETFQVSLDHAHICTYKLSLFRVYFAFWSDSFLYSLVFAFLISENTGQICAYFLSFSVGRKFGKFCMVVSGEASHGTSWCPWEAVSPWWYWVINDCIEKKLVALHLTNSLDKTLAGRIFILAG